MGRNTKYKMQAIDIPVYDPIKIPGITVPQINYGVGIGGKDRPENGATKGANWLSNLVGIPSDLFQTLANTLDDIANGTSYAKVLSTDISEGHILLSSVEGNLDNVGDGATYARVLLTGISAGKIVLAQVDGDLDDISNGGTYAKVASTNISAGNIILQVNQNLSTQGIKIITAATGARVELMSDANTGLAIFDAGGLNVLKAMIGGANVGDLMIGDYDHGQGILYDKSASKMFYKNVQWSAIVDDDTNKPDNNATLGATLGTNVDGGGVANNQIDNDGYVTNITATSIVTGTLTVGSGKVGISVESGGDIVLNSVDGSSFSSILFRKGASGWDMSYVGSGGGGFNSGDLLFEPAANGQVFSVGSFPLTTIGIYTTLRVFGAIDVSGSYGDISADMVILAASGRLRLPVGTNLY